MRTIRPILAVAAVAFVFLAGERVQAQQLPKDYAKNDKLQRTKGEVHKAMAKRVGKWKITSQFAPKFGGAKEKGECTMRTVLDGKFIMYEGTATMMGKPHKILSLYGYDTLNKEYIVINLNSIYTAAYEMRGKKRKDGVVEFKGIMKDAFTPKGRPHRVEEKKQSDDKFEVLIYDGVGDKEFLVLTMTYQRMK
jgi:hypothetical protein